MLRIKEDKLEEFKQIAYEWGFKLNDTKNAYVIRFHTEEEYPDDYLELQVGLDGVVTLETSNSRYSGIATNGDELEIIYDLTVTGFIEKYEYIVRGN
jgi:hypothetical protein